VKIPKNTKFENKIMLIFIFILVLGISLINAVSVVYFKFNLENSISKEINCYKRIFKYDPYFTPPSYLIINKITSLSKDYEIVGKVDDYYIFLKKSYKTQKLKSFASTLFIWEGIIVISLILIMYLTIINFLKKEEENLKFLEILVLSITHKIGNFLAIQKLNIDILKMKCSEEKAVYRIEENYKFIEKDFKITLESIQNLKSSEKKKLINIKDVITEIVKNFEDVLKEKDLKLKLKDCYIKISEIDAENIIFNLIENSVKYSKKSIYIKVCCTQKYFYLIIKNDISEQNKGTGIGLEIVKYLLQKNNGRLYTKAKKNYLVVVKIKK
jgi:two-component sensor histidine kinase